MSFQLLFVGDSITEGVDGFSYIRLLRQDYPRWQMTNLGLGGDTLVGIGQRLLHNVAQQPEYDCIILEAGHNDLLIPYMQQGSRAFRFIAQRLIQRGSRPTPNPAQFAQQLQDIIDNLRDTYAGPVIVTTLSCLGETLENELNRQRQQINAAIRRIAAHNQLYLADAGAVFDAQLAGKEKTAVTVLSNPYAMLLIDQVCSRSRACVTWLSRRRHTHLTIDGVHLNVAGAHIYRNVLKACLDELQ